MGSSNIGRIQVFALVVAAAICGRAAAQDAAQDAAPQPSFDCDAATQPLETLICADEELASLDADLAQAYRTKLAATSGDAQATLRLEQRAWAGNRAAACGIDGGEALEVDDAIGCLSALYRARIDALAPPDTATAAPPPSSGYA
ncbi:MAG TPA: lysozyme inhibitor LprI family protein, partial [Alphaproteobacteria bacterium]|nr:lysozyme inhibitor LprI family protein [Alphaproteobacteria bacterium]